MPSKQNRLHRDADLGNTLPFTLLTNDAIRRNVWKKGSLELDVSDLLLAWLFL